MKDVLTVTLNPSIDKSAEAEKVEPEHKLRCSKPVYQPGGGGINVSRVIKMLGGQAKTIYVAGKGFMLNDLLEKEGISCCPIKTSSVTRENLMIFETSTGHNYRFNMPGVALSKEEEEIIISGLADSLQESAYVVFSGSLPEGTPGKYYQRLIKLASEKNTKVILDTSSLKEVLSEKIFLIKPNKKELFELADQADGSVAKVKEVALSTAKKYQIENVVVSLGSEGVVLVAKGEPVFIPSPKVKVLSAVGAGDSMVGGITYGLSTGWTIEESVKLGVACGAAAVMTPGSDLCKKSDVEALYNDMTNLCDKR